MNKKLVTRDQKNELYLAIVNAELNPKEFRWEERPSGKTSRVLVSAICHIPTDHYFIFDYTFQHLLPYRVECSLANIALPK